MKLQVDPYTKNWRIKPTSIDLQRIVVLAESISVYLFAFWEEFFLTNNYDWLEFLLWSNTYSEFTRITLEMHVIHWALRHYVEYNLCAILRRLNSLSIQRGEWIQFVRLQCMHSVDGYALRRRGTSIVRYVKMILPVVSAQSSIHTQTKPIHLVSPVWNARKTATNPRKAVPIVTQNGANSTQNPYSSNVTKKEKC